MIDGYRGRAPVIVFAYNRKDHLQKTLEALNINRLAEESELYVFSDGSRTVEGQAKVQEVRDYIEVFRKESVFARMTVYYAEKNKGLANSVISGVTSIMDQYGKAIVVEDDLVVSKDFLEYMNQALDHYECDSKIWAISGYTPPLPILKSYEKDIFIGYRMSSWGWATWKDRWEKVDWQVSDYDVFIKDKKRQKEFNRAGPDMTYLLMRQMNGFLDSWAIRWTYQQFKEKMYTLYPKESRVHNLGMDGSGTHCNSTSRFVVDLKEDHQPCEMVEIKENAVINRELWDIGQVPYPIRFKRIFPELLFALLRLRGYWGHKKV